MTDDTAVCLDCHRPLKDPASIARQRGRYCQEIFEGDTHISPKPRRPARRKRLAEDRPFPGFGLREQVAALGDLARELFEAQFELLGGRKPADPTWDDLEPFERDEFWDQARRAEHVITRRHLAEKTTT